MPEPATLGTAQVAISVSLDQLDRGLASAHSRLNQFDQDTNKSRAPLQALEAASIRTASAVEDLTAQLSKQQAAVDQQVAAIAKATEAANRLGSSTHAANDNFAAANDNMKNTNQTIIEAAESWGKFGLEVFKVYGYVKLAASVLSQAFPALAGLKSGLDIGPKVTAGLATAGATVAGLAPQVVKAGEAVKGFTPAALGLGAAVAGVAPAFTKTGAAITSTAAAVDKTREVWKPFKQILEATEIVSLANHFKLASVAALALSPAVRSVATHEVVAGVKAIGPAIATITPAATAAGSVTSSILGPALATIARFAAPLLLVAAAFKTLTALFEIGQDKISKITDEMTGLAAGAGVSRDFFERNAKAAEEFKIETEAASEMLKKFHQVTQEALGGSPFESLMRDLTNAGNFVGNTGVAALKSATSTEERYRAVVELLAQAGAAGERLAALKVAESFLPPEMLDRARAGLDFLKEWQAKADHISQTDLISQKNLLTSLQLKTSLDESNKIFEDIWKASLPGIEEAGLAIYGVWVKIYSLLAQAAKAMADFADSTIKAAASSPVIKNTVDEIVGISKAISAAGSSIIASTKTDVTNIAAVFNSLYSGYSKVYDQVFGVQQQIKQTSETTKEGATSAEDTSTALSAEAAAYTQLALGMRDYNAVMQSTIQANAIYNSILGDQSRAITGSAKAYTDLVQSTLRHIATQESQAQTVGQGNAAQEKLRVQMELTTLATKAGIIGFAGVREEIEKLSAAAGAAAGNLQAAQIALQQKVDLRQAEQEVETAKTMLGVAGQSAAAQAKIKAALDVRHQAELEAMRTGIPVNKEYLDLLTQQKVEAAGLNAELEKANALAELRKSIKFERETISMGLSPQDVAIAQQLHAIWPDKTAAEVLATTEAAQLRLNDSLKQAQSDAGEFINTFVSGLVQGKSLVDSLASAVGNLGASITRAASTNLGNAIVGSISQSTIGSSIGGGLASIFGTGASAFGGPIAGLAVGGALSFISSLFGNSEKKKQEEQAALQAQQQATQQLEQLQSALAGAVDGLKALNDVSGDITSSIKSAQRQYQQVLTASNAVITQARVTGGVTVNAAITNQASADAVAAMKDAAEQLSIFTERTIKVGLEALAGSDALGQNAQAIADLNKKADDLRDAMIAAGKSAYDASVAVDQALATALERLKNSVTADLISKINTLSGKGYLNDLTNLFATIADAKVAGVDANTIDEFFTLSAQKIIDDAKLTGAAYDELIAKYPDLINKTHAYARSMDDVIAAAESLNDRLFNALNDTSTLEGQLAAFDRQANKERADEQKAGGQNMVLLEETLLAERTKIIDDFNKQAIEKEKQAAQARLDAMNAAAKGIVDYVNGLFAGSQSTLSPINKLAAAQNTYAATLALAQQGNIDAQNRITADAENLRTALRAVYGSTQQYQQGVQQIASDLLGLPAVQETTDPVVQAIRDSIVELQKITPAINTGTDTTATGLNNVDQSVTSVDQTSNNMKDLLAAIDVTTKATTDQIIATNQLMQAANNLATATTSLLTTMTSLLDAIVNLQTVANQSLAVQQAQLELLNAQFAVSPVASAYYQTGGSVTASNTMVEALNKIVINTGATAYNTAGTWGAIAHSSTPSLSPVFATGGWVRGGTAGKDSVPLIAQPGEYIVREDAASRWSSLLEQINKGGPPPLPATNFGTAAGAATDSIGSLITEIKSLRKEVSDLSKDNNRSTVLSAQVVREGIDRMDSRLIDMTREQKLSGQRRMVGK